METNKSELRNHNIIEMINSLLSPNEIPEISKIYDFTHVNPSVFLNIEKKNKMLIYFFSIIRKILDIETFSNIRFLVLFFWTFCKVCFSVFIIEK